MLGKRRARSVGAAKKANYKRQSLSVSARANRTIALPRLPFIWTSVTYCDYPYSLNPGAAGAAGVHVLAANGLYDVDIFGVGHQPTGFDQYMALYNNYTVTEAEIEVTFVNTDTTNMQNIGISIQDLSSTSTDVRRYIENGNCVTKIIGNATGASPNIGTLKMRVRMSDFFRNRGILTDDTFQGTSSANPTELLYFHVFAAPLDTTTDASIVSARITIRFRTIFRNPSLNTLS